MRILDIYGAEISSPDLERGYLREEEIFLKHHDALPSVTETGHYEVIAEYPNGGKDVAWVIDTPGMEARDAWDEYEKICRYILYSEEELARREAEKNQLPLASRVANLEEALDMILKGVTA